MKQIIFIHGNGGGTGHDCWYPWCKQELEKLGVQVLTPDFPEAELAPASVWLPYLEHLGVNQDTILVGHSTGAIAAMRYAETHKIGGSVLVGAYYTDLGDAAEKKAGYFDDPWKWEAIKRNQPWIIQFASTDDPYIPIEEPHFVRDHLGTEYREFTDQGHFGVPNAKLEFPELVAALKQKL